MTRLDEIADAMRTKPTTMFLFGLVQLAHSDYEGIMRDMVAAERVVFAEQQKEARNVRD